MTISGNDNEATVRRVLRFLDVNDRVPIHMMDANPTVRVRSVRLDELMRKLHSRRGPARALNTAVKTLTPQRTRRRLVRTIRRQIVYGEPQAPPESAMMELRARYKAEVVALSEYLGCDLVGRWGYDRVG